MNPTKAAFLVGMFGAPAFAAPAEFGSSGLAIGAQIAARPHSL
jgi:Asp-tRNA(Asn)/Glu-tRNA(Gln) amidotransferase A subunit family amidase